MPNYIINSQTDNHGYNEVHTTTCGHLPDSKNQATLGWYTDEKAAVAAAKAKGYKNADGCYYCCPDAHHD